MTEMKPFEQGIALRCLRLDILDAIRGHSSSLTRFQSAGENLRVLIIELRLTLMPSRGGEETLFFKHHAMTTEHNQELKTAKDSVPTIPT